MPPPPRPEQVDDCKQDDCAQERTEQRHGVERTRGNPAATDQRADQKAAQHCADNADHDVEQNALLAIGAHDEASEPTDNAANDKYENECHGLGPFKLYLMQQRCSGGWVPLKTRNALHCEALGIA
jgi:hypothetical protein